MAKFKVGDYVQINPDHFSASWQSSYNLQLKKRYQVLKTGTYNTIKSVDPKEPINYTGLSGKGTIELDNNQIIIDEDFIKERLEQLFG